VLGGVVHARPGQTTMQPAIGAREKPVLTLGAQRFHDLNGDGKLQPYEDWRLSPERRTADLLSRMTLEEKAGLLVHGTPPNIGGGIMGNWDIEGIRPAIEQRQMRFFVHRMGGDGAPLAKAANAIQEIAEKSRLGIPIVISSDPRNTYRSVFGLSVPAGQFTRWPESLGLAGLADADLVRRLSEISSREYRAVGIRMAISPTADLFTDPRWTRGNGTFGDDPVLVAKLLEASVEGFQGGKNGVGPNSVATVVKHWVGYGGQKDGLDSHNPYGQVMHYPGNGFALHVKAFEGAFAARTAGVMPTYSRPEGLVIDGKRVESVGAGFNKQMIQGLLREKEKFDGVVISDFKITDDCAEECQAGTKTVALLGMPWGVETLTKPQRFAKAFNAGVDQIGGVEDAGIVADLARSGELSKARLDQAAGRLIKLMFQLGVFENAYVDPDVAQKTLGSPDSIALAADVQRRSLVLLKNAQHVLPLAPGKAKKVWLWNVSEEAARAHGFEPVADPRQAEVAILRINAPYTSHPKFFFGASMHEGSLEFAADNKDRMAVERAAAAGIPVITSVYLDRPAVLTPILANASAVLGDFGVSDNAVLDVVLGKGRPEGRLPVELPSSDAAVAAQKSDLPSDSAAPLFARGFGLRY
jgi:beta-glucosidase